MVVERVHYQFFFPKQDVFIITFFTNPLVCIAVLKVAHLFSSGCLQNAFFFHYFVVFFKLRILTVIYNLFPTLSVIVCPQSFPSQQSTSFPTNQFSITKIYYAKQPFVRWLVDNRIWRFVRSQYSSPAIKKNH